MTDVKVCMTIGCTNKIKCPTDPFKTICDDCYLRQRAKQSK